MDNVHRFGFGPGRTALEPSWIQRFFARSRCLQGLECGSSPTLGTQTPSSEGVFALSVCTKLVVRPSDARFAGYGRAAAVACSGVWVAGSVP